MAIGKAIAISLAALGAGLGQGRAVASAMEGIGRNPAAAGKLFVPMILGLVFMESLVILSFVIGSDVSPNSRYKLFESL